MSLYVVCSLIVCCLSTFLVLHPKYEDGLFGRIALLCIGLSCAVVLGEFSNGVEYDVNPTTIGVQLGIALFFIRHVYRFNKWANGGSFDWRKNEKNTPSHDVVCPLLLGGSKTKSRRKPNDNSKSTRSRILQEQR